MVKLLESEKGHYVFMDFWGIWCGSCMLDMPNYPAFMDKSKGKPIKFIFFAIQTNPQQINEVKNKYGIDAKFISLTDDETAIMNNVLDFSAIPAQFVIDPSGYVVSNEINNDQVGYKGGIVNKAAVDQVMHLLEK